MQMYSCMTLLQNEAAIMLMEHRNPPAIITGRLPYVFTRILLIGPEIEDRAINMVIRLLSCRKKPKKIVQ